MNIFSPARSKRKRNVESSKSKSCGKLYGRSVDSILSELETHPHYPTIPAWIITLVTNIKRLGGLDLEGLFRLEGSSHRTNQLQAVADSVGFINETVLTIADVHSLACLLKRFLREMPQPLLSYEYETFWENVQIYRMSYQPSALKAAVRSLPEGNRVLLEYLVLFLKEVAASSCTKMTAENLAIIFAPCFAVRVFPDDIARQAEAVAAITALINEPEVFAPRVPTRPRTRSVVVLSPTKHRTNHTQANKPKPLPTPTPTAKRAENVPNGEPQPKHQKKQ